MSLLPCPFCGAKSYMRFASEGMCAIDGSLGEKLFVACGKCGARGPFNQEHGEADKLWNTRPTPQPQDNGEAVRLAIEAFEKIGRMDYSVYFGAKCKICDRDISRSYKDHAHDCPPQIALTAADSLRSVKPQPSMDERDKSLGLGAAKRMIEMAGSPQPTPMAGEADE